jgi:hypothetical protein
MKRWRAVSVAFVACVALAGSAQAAERAVGAHLVVCKRGQVSTRLHRCSQARPTATPSTSTPTTVPLGPPIPVTDPNPDTGQSNPDVVDQGPRVCGCDADTVMHYLDPSAGTYQLVIYNTSGIGYINSVNWLPPIGLTVTAITGTTGGTCTLDAGDISCRASGAGLAPPKCTCETGGVMRVNFTATGDAPTFNGSWWTYYGLVGAYMQITSMTPVPWYIPSYVPQNNGV